MAARFTLDVATSFLLGDDVHSLAVGLPYPHGYNGYKQQHNRSKDNSKGVIHEESTDPDSYVQAFGLAQEKSALRVSFGSNWPVMEILSGHVLPHRAVLDEFTDPINERVLEKKRKGKLSADKSEYEETGDESESLIEHLARITNGVCLSLTEELRRFDDMVR